MALETKIRVPRHKHLVVDRAVRIVTSGAAFAHRFMLEHKRTALRCVALTAGVVLGEQRRSAASHRWTFMRIVATAATHLPVQHRVAVGQLELSALVQVALEADFGRLPGIDDRVMRPAGLIVNAARAVARFASNLRGIRPMSLQPCMRRGSKTLRDVLVALRAACRADKRCPRNLRWRDDLPHHCAAGNDYAPAAKNDNNSDTPTKKKLRA